MRLSKAKLGAVIHQPSIHNSIGHVIGFEIMKINGKSTLCIKVKFANGEIESLEPCELELYVD